MNTYTITREIVEKIITNAENLGEGNHRLQEYWPSEEVVIEYDAEVEISDRKQEADTGYIHQTTEIMLSNISVFVYDEDGEAIEVFHTFENGVNLDYREIA